MVDRLDGTRLGRSPSRDGGGVRISSGSGKPSATRRRRGSGSPDLIVRGFFVVPKRPALVSVGRRNRRRSARRCVGRTCHYLGNRGTRVACRVCVAERGEPALVRRMERTPPSSGHALVARPQRLKSGGPSVVWMERAATGYDRRSVGRPVGRRPREHVVSGRAADRVWFDVYRRGYGHQRGMGAPNTRFAVSRLALIAAST